MKQFVRVMAVAVLVSTTGAQADSWRTPRLDSICDAIEARVLAREAAIKLDTNNDKGINALQLAVLHIPLYFISLYRDDNDSFSRMMQKSETKVPFLSETKLVLSLVSWLSIIRPERFTNAYFTSGICSAVLPKKRFMIELPTAFERVQNLYTSVPNERAQYLVKIAEDTELLFKAMEGFRPLTAVQLKRRLFINDASTTLSQEVSKGVNLSDMTSTNLTAYYAEKSKCLDQIQNYFDTSNADISLDVRCEFRKLMIQARMLLGCPAESELELPLKILYILSFLELSDYKNIASSDHMFTEEFFTQAQLRMGLAFAESLSPFPSHALAWLKMDS